MSRATWPAWMLVCRALGSLMIMGAGSAMVFWLMVGMNACQDSPSPTAAQTSTSLAVAPKPPPPPKPPPKPEAKPRRAQAARAQAPPPPSFGGGLSAPGFSLPGLSASGIDPQRGQLLGQARASVMTEDAVDAKPVPERRVAAQYPPRARAQGVTGYVLMSLLIDERGQVERVKILEAEPAGVFEDAAREAIQGWTFQPARYKGEAVKTWAKQRIHFKLS